MDTQTFELESGELELAPTPGHVNVIARDGEWEAELSLKAPDLETLRRGLVEDVKVDVDTDTGLISWEPGRGLYVEVYDGPDFYLVFSPSDREDVASGILTARPL